MLGNDPLWYKDAIVYELHVRAFHDHLGDGMGDFRGLTEKLDYLEDLGVTAVWLLPYYPSPLRDDGYDIADYTSIHQSYGTLRDFKDFLVAAHQRGLRVINELVLNHTSDQHPWFQRARRSPPGSPYRDFYVWTNAPDKYREARIIFKDFEQSNWSWDPLAKAYYWHRFYHHQPDLNYDNPEVWKAIFPLVDFWLGMGVDGMRLDAVPYLYEREGTNCENLPETHAFLKALRKHVEGRFANRMLLSEANQWPEDAAAYFGQGDETHMAFHFPVMPRLFMAIHMEDRFPIVDIMAQTPAIPDNCQWAMFLRNHDELTLEMVTDEERDYMYRAYAGDPQARINLGIRRRLAPLLGNNRRRIELMNALLFSLPGTPIIYYGEEIGMGDNIYLGDRNSVRTPMQWSADRNAGFSRANPQKLYLPIIIDPEYHYEAVNVEAQQANPNSLLWWVKRLIALRKRFRAFGRGTLEFLQPENRKILAFLRRYQDESILVVANMSRFVQYVEMDLSKFQGLVPTEMFGRTVFPPIGSLPYLFTLGPHSFYWFSLDPQGPTVLGATEPAVEGELPVVAVEGCWEAVFTNPGKASLEERLPRYLRQRRWFASKARSIKNTVISEAFRVPYAGQFAYVTLVRVEFHEGAAETYVLPLAFAAGDAAAPLLEGSPQAVVVKLHAETDGILYDALASPRFCSAILEAIGGSETFESGSAALISAQALSGFNGVRQQAESLAPSLSRAEQSNTSVFFGNAMILKVFRRVDEGINPDLEIGRYLTEKAQFPNTAAVLGSVEYQRRRRAEPLTLAILQSFVPNQGDAFQLTLDVLSRYFEQILTSQPVEPAPAVTEGLLELAASEPPPAARDKIHTYLETAQLLGRRTAELHAALAAEIEDVHFAPEPFSPHYQRSIYQSMRNLKAQVFHQLQLRLPDLPAPVRELALKVQDREPDILRCFHQLLDQKIATLRTRTHGDYHLGQVLYTGKDFVIIDFEGEPSRSISERRIKRSPLRDVAGMVRSFHYAANSALHSNGVGRGQSPGVLRPEDRRLLEPWARFWYSWVAASFLKAYLEQTANAAFVPQSRSEFKVLLQAFLLEKAIYELGYELNSRPDWVRIPLLGILLLLGE